MPFPRVIAVVLATLLLVPLAGCGTASRVVRLDAGQGRPLVHTPRHGEAPVELRKGEFHEALAELARDVRPATNPLSHARRLMFDSPWQEAVYLKWTGRRLVLDAEVAEALQSPQASHELTRDYGRWCERKGRPRDCLSLLKEGPVLTADGRYALAMELALGSVWNETREAFKDMADPEAVRATVVSAMALYMMLWVLPEPVSKGLAATLTAGLIAYLGVDTVWSLMRGWMRLVDEVDHATSFAELREAGERFGKVMGQNSARVFILLATAAIGNTAGLAVKGPGLPGSSQAMLLAESQGGFRFTAIAEVESVAVSSEGAFTIALAPGAVATTAQAMSGAPGSVEAEGHEHHIATNKWNDATHGGGPWTPKFKDIFDRAGMSLDDPANKVRIPGHKGPHPPEYHEEVYRRLNDAMLDCRSVQQCRTALSSQLQKLARELTTEGSRLHKLITKSR
ncbi:AHH domain-containing protein [Archangium sp.]|uniref:AHH domain-containing protein n=1 Tax=Archangium sp. TaxID=1872627 RepID=UPI002ED8B6F4